MLRDVQVQALLCPDCRENLPAVDGDVVFCCPTCEKGFELRENKLAEIRVEFALPRKQQNGPVFHLPFWAFDFSIRYSARDPAHAKLLGTMDRAYIPAFCFQRSSIVEDAGFHYTRGKLKHETGHFHKLVGSSRTSLDAVKYVQFTILALADEVSDVSNLEASVKILDSRLIGIPFHTLEHRLQEGLMGLEFSSQYAERLTEILEELNVRA